MQRFNVLAHFISENYQKSDILQEENIELAARLKQYKECRIAKAYHQSVKPKLDKISLLVEQVRETVNVHKPDVSDKHVIDQLELMIAENQRKAKKDQEESVAQDRRLKLYRERRIAKACQKNIKPILDRIQERIKDVIKRIFIRSCQKFASFNRREAQQLRAENPQHGEQFKRGVRERRGGKVSIERIGGTLGRIGDTIRRLKPTLEDFDRKRRELAQKIEVKPPRQEEGVVKRFWRRINTVSDTGRPWWEDASKIEHVEEYNKILEDVKSFHKGRYPHEFRQERQGPVHVGLEKLFDASDKIRYKLDDLERRVTKYSKKDPLLKTIGELRGFMKTFVKSVAEGLENKVEQDRERDLEEAIRRAKAENKKLSLSSPKKEEEPKKNKGRGMKF